MVIRNIIIVIIVFISLACSNIKKTERLADKGSVSDCYRVVEYYTCHKYYIPVTKDQEQKIIKYCIKGLSLDTAYSERYFFYKELAYYTDKREEQYASYKKAAVLNDGEAQWIVGLYYLEGREKEINNDSALYWLKRAATGNYYMYGAMANNELGNIYSKGKIVKQDSLTALYYYKKACVCFGNFSNLPACNTVISYYKNKSNSIDTTELAIYTEIARKLNERNSAK